MPRLAAQAGLAIVEYLWMKSLITIVAGVVVGGLVVFLVEAFGSLMLSMLTGIEPITAQCAAALSSVRPNEALLVVVLAYILGPLSGGYAAGRLAPRKPYQHAAVVGSIQLIPGMVTLALFPHPEWFWIATLLTFIPAALFGAGLAGSGRRRRRQKMS
jgi:hypothetical protein